MPRFSPRPTGGRRKRLPLEQRDLSKQAVPVPADLTPAERAAWARYAPAAHAMQTLVPETVEGFRLLCETVVLRDTARARLDAEGLTITTPSGELKAHPLCVHVRQLTQRLEALLAKFALVAPGRAVERPRRAEPDEVSKWLGVLPDVEHDSDDGTGYDLYS
jgi:phage terminase small subunit